MKNRLIIGLVVIIMLFTLVGCSKKGFVNQYNFDYFTENDELKLPMYFYANDGKNNIYSEEIIKIAETDQTVKFSDFKITDINDSDKMIISFKMNVESVIDSYYSTDLKSNINYVFSYINPIIFDYYTGDVYKTKEDNVANENEFKDPSVLKEEDFKANLIKWNNKEYTIGVYQQSIVSTDASKMKEEIIDGKIHFNSPTASGVKIFIMAPKNYDGIMLAINKNGSSKERILNNLNNSNNTASETTYKLIDSQDELRKQYNENSFYVMNVSQVLNIKRNNFNAVLLIIVVLLVLLIITIVMLIIIKKKKGGKK